MRIGHLVLLDAGEHFGIGESLVLGLIDAPTRASSWARRSWRVTPCRIVKVEHGIPLAAHAEHPDVIRLGEIRCPRGGRRGSVRRSWFPGVHDDVMPGRFSFGRSQTITEPGSQAGPAGNLASGLDVGDRRDRG